ncbi:MAG: hypothetical protein WC346_03895 [Methanogenium sp.]|jgi:hypothetical protein
MKQLSYIIIILIALMLLSLKSTCKSTNIDSIKIDILDIRLINRIFADYDRLIEINSKLEYIKTISYSYINNSNSIHTLMNNNIKNLHNIIAINNNMYDDMITKLERDIKRQKIKTIISVISGTIIIILIL